MSKIKRLQELEEFIRRQEMELKKMKVILGELQGKTSSQAVDYAIKASEVGKDSLTQE